MKKLITRKKTVLTTFGVLGILAALLSGCVDETTDEYQNSQAQKNFALYQAVAGTYSGSLTSLDGKTSKGGIQFTLNPTQAPNPSTNDSEAIFHGSVIITGSTELENSFTTGNYDPVAGTFNASISSSPTSGTTETLSLSGSISGGIFKGKISSDQHGNCGGYFTTQINGALPTGQALSSGPSTPATGNFTGTMADPACKTISNGKVVDTGTCSMTLKIEDSSIPVEDKFIDFFLESGNVFVSVGMNDVLQDYSAASLAVASPYPMGFGTSNGVPAQFDQTTKTLSGSYTTTNGSNAVLTLDCQEIDSGNNGSFGWNCTITSTQGNVTKFVVAPAAS